MGDPTGLSSIVIERLVNTGIDELKTIRECKEKGRALGDYLKTIRPLFDDATKTSLAGEDGSVGNWLGKLDKVLERAGLEAQKCEDVKGWNFWKKRRLSRRISKLTTEIDSILDKQVPIVLINLGVVFKEKLEEVHQEVGNVQQTLVRIEKELSRAEARQTLDDLRKLPNIVFGIQELLAKLENLLLAENQNEWVGLCGRGGIGKTVLAGQAYNSENVRARFDQQFWVTVAQRPKIEDLLKILAEKMKVNIQYMQADDAKSTLSNALVGSKVLLVLDDVWDDGIDVLGMLGVTSKGSGSKILVTTRERQVLKKAKARDECIVKVDNLSAENSWKLFCEHAFEGVANIPDELDRALIKKIVDECNGLPLALKVIARTLAGEADLAGEILSVTWESQLKNLQESRPLGKDQELQLYGILRPSYDSLPPRLQKCFLYFAAFPEDCRVDSQKLAKLWAGEKLLDGPLDPLKTTFSLLTELMRRSLIDLAWNNRRNPWHIQCRIHDVLRDFALYVIRPIDTSSGKQELMDCLFRAGRHVREVPTEWLEGDHTRDVTHLSLIDHRLEFLPNELRAPKLEVLLLNKSEFSRRLLVLSPEILQSFSSLKVLDLENCLLKSLPESVRSLKNLIYLELSGTSLDALPVGLQELKKLEYLSLRECTKISPWPFDISHLGRLSTLLTNGCECIWDAVPGGVSQGTNIGDSLESICKITGLLNLSISSASRVLLPSCLMKSMSGIKRLSLNDCSKLTFLPDTPKFESLEFLDLCGCESLQKLPDGFTNEGAFPVLQELDFSECSSLKNLPRIDKGAFPQLRLLEMTGCTSLRELPEGFSQRGAFPALEELGFSRCSSLENLPCLDEGAFPQLKRFNMTGCTSLKELPERFAQRGAFPALEELGFSRCSSLEKLSCIDVGAFPQLKRLHLTSCTSLKELPEGFAQRGAFPALEELFLRRSSLEKLPCIDVGAFPQLKLLNMTSCTSLKELLEGFAQRGAFPALELLSFSGCSSLEKLPCIEGGAFPQLKRLNMTGCTSLKELPKGFAQREAFPALEELNISQCSSLESLPVIDEGAFPQLQILDISLCFSLNEFPEGFTQRESFPALKVLRMGKCTGLQKFPDIEDGAFSELQNLFLPGCVFENLPTSFGHLDKLVELHLTSHCAIPDVLVRHEAEGKLKITRQEESSSKSESTIIGMRVEPSRQIPLTEVDDDKL